MKLPLRQRHFLSAKSGSTVPALPYLNRLLIVLAALDGNIVIVLGRILKQPVIGAFSRESCSCSMHVLKA
jgi:hypothetical protein